MTGFQTLTLFNILDFFQQNQSQITSDVSFIITVQFSKKHKVCSILYGLLCLYTTVQIIYCL